MRRLFALVFALVAVTPVTAQVQTISSVTTTTVTGTSQTRTLTTNADGTATTSILYNGTEQRLTGFTAAGVSYTAAGSGSVFVRRNSATPAPPTSNTNQTSTWNTVVGTAGGVQTVNGRYYNTAEALIGSNNVRSGFENLFRNSGGSATGPVSNVERLDFVFSTPLTAAAGQGFAVFERGLGGGGVNGAFRIAAITGVAGTTPTAYGSVLTVGENSYGTGGAVSAASYTVLETGNNGTDLNTLTNDTIGPQGVSGAFVPVTSLTTAGTTVYGYSVFADDVSSANLTNLANFSTTTSTDLDLLSTGVQFFTPVPEPVTVLGVAALALGGGRAVRRRRVG